MNLHEKFATITAWQLRKAKEHAKSDAPGFPFENVKIHRVRLDVNSWSIFLTSGPSVFLPGCGVWHTKIKAGKWRGFNDGFLVSVVLCRWESETKIRSDEGLTLQTSAF